jgi:hypothetical protein
MTGMAVHKMLNYAIIYEGIKSIFPIFAGFSEVIIAP